MVLHDNPPTPILVHILRALLFFLAVSAIIPGLMFVVDPSGTIMKMPLSMLQHSPFPDFFIPGVFLLIVLGVMPLVIFIGLLKSHFLKWADWIDIDRHQHWSHTFSFYSGIVLILWIDFQVMFIRSIHILHLAYSLLGVAIVAISQMPAVREFYRK